MAVVTSKTFTKIIINNEFKLKIALQDSKHIYTTPLLLPNIYIHFRTKHILRICICNSTPSSFRCTSNFVYLDHTKFHISHHFMPLCIL